MTKLTEFVNGRTMAEFYDSGWGPTALEPFAQDLATEAAEGKFILDLGCGTGVVTRYAAERADPEARIIGLDPTPILLNAARSNPDNPKNIEWVDGSGEKMPFGDDSFDVVLCHQCLQYLTDKESTFKELKRVLKKGGRLIGSVWASKENQPSLAYLEEAIGRHFGSEHAPMHAWQFGGLEELQKQATNAGFEVVKLETRVFPWKFDSIQHLAYTHIAGAGRTDEHGQLALGLVDLEDPKSDQLTDEFTADLEGKLGTLLTSEGVIAPFATDVLIAEA